MFKPELWQSHDGYRTLVTTVGRRLSRNNPRSSAHWYFLSYSLIKPRLAHALLPGSGMSFPHPFPPLSLSAACPSTDKLPPLGPYYDLMNRFWQGGRHVYSRPSLLPAGRNGKKPEKVIGSDGKLSEPQDTASTTTRDIVDDIMDGKPVSGNTQEALQKIFSILAVPPSLQAGLFDAAGLTVSGGGTAVASHSSPYGRHLSSCDRSCPFRSTCGRHYSDPDAGWGWDSDNETWFFGHTLYMPCCRNVHNLKYDLIGKIYFKPALCKMRFFFYLQICILLL